MPPVEAFILGTPVIVANLPGFEDQVGNAGILIDPSDPVSLSDAILSLAKNKAYRQELIKRGKKRSDLFSDFERLKTLRSIFDAYARKRRAWTTA